MAKAKRQRRTSIRTMQADHALEALELLERAESPRAEVDDEAAEGSGTGTKAPPEREEQG